MLICDLILSKIFRKYMSEEDLKQEMEWIETEPDVLQKMNNKFEVISDEKIYK